MYSIYDIYAGAPAAEEAVFLSLESSWFWLENLLALQCIQQTVSFRTRTKDSFFTRQETP